MNLMAAPGTARPGLMRPQSWRPGSRLHATASSNSLSTGHLPFDADLARNIRVMPDLHFPFQGPFSALVTWSAGCPGHTPEQRPGAPGDSARAGAALRSGARVLRARFRGDIPDPIATPRGCPMTRTASSWKGYVAQPKARASDLVTCRSGPCATRGGRAAGHRRVDDDPARDGIGTGRLTPQDPLADGGDLTLRSVRDGAMGGSSRATNSSRRRCSRTSAFAVVLGAVPGSLRRVRPEWLHADPPARGASSLPEVLDKERVWRRRRVGDVFPAAW